jgi:hypothetical protein
VWLLLGLVAGVVEVGLLVLRWEELLLSLSLSRARLELLA